MWLITTIGFFSIVRKHADDDLTVRARARGDLDALRQEYLPTLGATVEGGGTDYPFRARVPANDLASAVERMVKGIEYANFKNEVAARQGHQRAHVYAEVWNVLQKLSEGVDR